MVAIPQFKMQSAQLKCCIFRFAMGPRRLDQKTKLQQLKANG